MYKVLHLDDNPVNRMLMERILSLKSLELTTYADPQTALELSDITTFDLIITDYLMPIMDGLQFINHIRNQGILTPAILLSLKSAVTLPHNVKFLRKPFLSADLFKMIEELLDTKL